MNHDSTKYKTPKIKKKLDQQAFSQGVLTIPFQEDLLQAIELYDVHALHFLDVQAHCSWTSYVLIVSLPTFTQIKGLFKDLRTLFRDYQLSVWVPKKLDVKEDWILLDAGLLCTHLMLPQAYTFYELDQMFPQAKILKENLSLRKGVY